LEQGHPPDRDAAAVVLATGGFQGKAMMMRQQFESMPWVVGD